MAALVLKNTVKNYAAELVKNFETVQAIVVSLFGWLVQQSVITAGNK